MSAMTKAMTPSAHELSQIVGGAVMLTAAKPAVAGPLWHMFIEAVVKVEIMLLDFDAECEDMSDAIDRQLADWRDELDWSTYELVAVAS